ncbi:MAG: phage major capsid protein [Pseudobdellovibrionaceae bacterium]
MIDTEKRTVEISFASETPYERWFGNEILSHDKGACDLTRLNDGGPILFNHNMDVHLGVSEKAWIGNEKTSRLIARFSKSAIGEEKWQDVQDGILKNVSVGYMIEEMILKKKGKDGDPSDYLVTKWVPYEVSFVTVPADNTVGVGRSMESEEQVEIEIKNEIVEEVQQTINAETTATERALKMSEVKTAVEAAQKVERERTAAILAIGEKYEMTEVARQLIEKGASVEEMKTAALEKLGMKKHIVTATDGNIGMGEKEIKQFSFMRALNALANPNDKAAQEAAGFEREVSIAASKRSGKTPQGFLVPTDILRSALAQRDLTVGTSTAGGDLVKTDLMSQSFIELLRNKSILQAAGATTLNGLQGQIAIPRQTGGATAYWVAESGNVTESAQAFDQVTMSPKTVGGFTDYSRKLLLQSSIDVESLIRGDLAKVLALEIDRVGLYGSGSSNQPLGMKGTSGIGTKDFAAATPTFAEVVYLETVVAAANADIGAMKYLTNATMRGSLKTAPKVSGYPVFIWENNELNGYPALVSNQVASGDLLFGNWADMLIGFWSGLDLLVDPYTASIAGTVRVVAMQDVDVAVRHAESFSRGNDVL